MQKKKIKEEIIKEQTPEEQIVEQENIKEKTQENVQQNNNVKKFGIGKIIGLITKTVGWLILILLLIILVRALVYKKYDVFGYRFYLIMSGSMEPTIDVSDAVITKEIDNPQDGDIIAFQYQGAPTVHRIIKTYTENGEKSYQTKGDNNNIPDKGLVNKSQIYGKVIFRIPKVGRAIIFLQKNIVIILILIVGIVIIISLIRRLI